MTLRIYIPTPVASSRPPRAALAALVAAILLAGCGDDGTKIVPPDPPAPVASVEVSPLPPDLAVGETWQLSATPRAADGTPLPNRTVTWSSSDPGVASVGASGLVRGEARGQAVITATSEGVGGTAALRVFVPNLIVEDDLTLDGELSVDSVRIAPGATLTLGGPLRIEAMGPVDIAGDVRGSCRALVIESAAEVTLTGDVDNACATAPDGDAPGITVVATGLLTLDGVEMRTSGDVSMTNDAGLTDDEFNAFAFTDGPVAVPGFGQDSPYACVARDYRFVPAPARAADGADGGPVGGDGADGSTWVLGCRGDGLLENVQIFGQGGGDGGRGEDRSAADATARGGDGGNGGLLKARITGSLTIRGEGTEFESGDGGKGGPARAEPAQNGAAPVAPSADASAGDGGLPGLLDVWALGGISVLDAGVVARIGHGGEGGLAFARGADGVAADVRNAAAQAGGSASAHGGDGGASPPARLRVVGPSIAANLLLQGGDAGAGGNAEAEAGRGGDADALHPAGGDGGSMHAAGGFGGDAEVVDAAGLPIGAGGNAGFAFFEGGRGGDGWNECRPLLLPGGPGGAGGSTTGSDGIPGLGAANGLDGEVVFAAGTGDGGRGGDGIAPGNGGSGGTDQVTVNGRRVAGPAFQDGRPGDPCVVPALLQPVVDLGAVLGDPNLFWAWLLLPPNPGPIPHPSPLIPPQDRPTDHVGVHRLASVRYELGPDQAGALHGAYPCGDRGDGWTRCGAGSGSGPLAPGPYYVFVVAMGSGLPALPTEHLSYVVALDADGDPTNNYAVTPGFENDPYVGTDRFYELNFTPGVGWRMVGVDARNTQPVEMVTGARVIVVANTMVLLVPASEVSAPLPGVRFVSFLHVGDFGLQGGIWSMDRQPAPDQTPAFIATVSIPPAAAPGR